MRTRLILLALALVPHMVPTIVAQEPPSPPAYTWTAAGQGVITWTGPGVLTKRRGAAALWIATADAAGVVSTDAPGPPPVDVMLRPYPGDIYCAEPGGCVTVPRRELPLYLPLVGR